MSQKGQGVVCVGRGSGGVGRLAGQTRSGREPTDQYPDPHPGRPAADGRAPTPRGPGVHTDRAESEKAVNLGGGRDGRRSAHVILTPPSVSERTPCHVARTPNSVRSWGWAVWWGCYFKSLPVLCQETSSEKAIPDKPQGSHRG